MSWLDSRRDSMSSDENEMKNNELTLEGLKMNETKCQNTLLKILRPSKRVSAGLPPFRK
jgi:hypothetical protein